MQQVRLEKFKKEDATFLQENFSYGFLDKSIENFENIIEGWKTSLGFCIVYNDEKVGFISLSEKQDKKLSWGTAIKEEYRGKGIAGEAFKLIVQEAKKRGYFTIISSCAKSNTASQALHKKVGFSLIKEEINQAGNELCRWEMNI